MTAGGRLSAPARLLGSSARRAVSAFALVAIGAYFLVPFAAGLQFTLVRQHKFSFSAYGDIPSSPGFADALLLSCLITVAATVVTLGVLIPTALLVHLFLPAVRPFVEAACMLPLAVPPVVLASGALSAFHSQALLINSPYVLSFLYAVLALPYSFRALDAGLAVIDLRTMVEASRSLGASWRQTALAVVFPNIREAIGAAGFMTIALALGEFVIANVLLFPTLPTWLVQFGASDATLSVAVSTLSLILIWMVLVLISLATNRRKPAATPRPLGGRP